MKNTILVLSSILLLFVLISLINPNKNSDREKEAYNHTIEKIEAFILKNQFHKSRINIIILAYKKEKILQIFMGENGKNFIPYNQFEICSMSGELGPKIQMGDEQTPEGFYYIDRFNPQSRFLLSLGLNYPNAADKIRSQKLAPGTNLGGDIFIHGSCVSIGCMAMTDHYIEEIYTLAKLAKTAGQSKIPVYIFPMDFKDKKNANFENSPDFSAFKSSFLFWKNLKTGYDNFNSTHLPLKTTVSNTGSYIFN